jgi:prevent-host-death family protein
MEIGAVAAKHLITAGELVRRFSQYSDIALVDPVVVTKNGRPRNVLISIEEYERLKKRDQQAFLAGDTPERFLADIEAFAAGESS